MKKKRVILLMVDTLMDETLQQAISKGEAPTIKLLMEHGTYIPDVVSSFPTMSVNIDSTLITGLYADKHRIPGLCWYDTNKNKVINYGTGVKEIMKYGLGHVLNNLYGHLNNRHICTKTTTIHEQLDEKKILTASLNSFIYRGNYLQRLKFPIWLANGFQFEEQINISAPYYFSLGSMKKIKDENNLNWRFFVGDNKNVVRELQYLIKNDLLPIFTVAYFQDLDMKIHKYGPAYTKGVKKVDKRLKQLFHSFTSFEQALEENIWIILSDNGQTPIGNSKHEHLIDLRNHYYKYKIAKVRKGGRIKPSDEVLISVNQRMAYIYTLNKKICTDELVSQVKDDRRIDLIVCNAGDGIKVYEGGKETEFYFKRGGKLTDEYDQSWSIQGDESIVDITLNNNHISYGSFPDALRRLEAAMNSHDGNFIIINARPGYEFIAEKTPHHLGGAAHGSLYKRESLVPLIFTGTNLQPPFKRIVDIKQWLMQIIEKELNL